MKIKGLRMGTKFVLEYRGGLWEKIAENKAVCVFGDRESYGQEIEVDPEAFAFGFFERPVARREPDSNIKMSPEMSTGIRVTMVDSETDTVLVTYEGVGPSALAAISMADSLGVLLPKRRKKREYVIMDTHFDMEDRGLVVVIREDKPIGGVDKDDIPMPDQLGSEVQNDESHSE